MAKRSGHFQLKQPLASKKPKLDIEIVPSQQYNPQPSTSKAGSSSGAGKSAATAATTTTAENLWDDDDDDIIVLATQAIEADLTFGKFSRSVKTSTQQTTEVIAAGGQHTGAGKLPGKVPDKLVAELFADGEDDLFSEKLDDNYRNIDNAINDYFNNNDDDFNLDEFRQEEQAPSVGGRREPAPKASREEAPSVGGKRSGEPQAPKASWEEPPSVGGKPTPSHTPKPEAEEKPELASSQKQEHAKDIQVKFLTKHVEQLAKKVDSLQKDYTEAVEKAQVKDGEVSMLRYELKMVKTANEQLRLEKMREKETIQKEWLEKMKNLEKTISAQKVENEFKEMEIMNLKTKRLNATFRSAEPAEPQPPEPPPARAAAEPAPSTSAQPKVTEATEDEFDLASLLPKLRQLRKYSRVTRNEFAIADQLVSLQTFLSQMLIAAKASGDETTQRIVLSPGMYPLVAIATEKGLEEIDLYCQRLGQHKETDFRLNGPKSTMEQSAPVNVFQQEQLYNGEQAVVIRRFLAVVGLYCRISDELVVKRLLEKELVLRLAKNMKRISTAIILTSLHGLVTGAAALLNGISFRPRRFLLYGASGSQLMELFRSIVLCQPDAPSSMLQLSDFLRRLSHITDGSVNHLLNRLCISHHPVETGQKQQQQEEQQPTTSRRQYRLKTISFSLGTCTLQMYAALLENSVRPHDRYEAWQMKPLLTNTENTIHFLRNVLLHPVGWVKSFYDREDPNECELCHIRMVSAFVTLLFRVLLCWNQQSVKDEEDVSHIHCIARHGVLLLYDLFQTAYHKKLLRIAGPTVRYRLRVTYNWLQLYQKEFNFDDIHSETLGMLDMRLLMPDPLRAYLEAENDDTEAEKKEADSEDARRAESNAIMEELFAGFFNTYANNSATLL
ncbi:AGAP008194-PA [Anopheles gambiae str. PEST]|uniref:AGAP008194-PA n=1 Tax=Anopheles gambiae TaxID=7165 RepID=Q7Q441_ANOGA|nr:AGAP008194-PA [Anopheles gambiae str. PEST]